MDATVLSFLFFFPQKSVTASLATNNKWIKHQIAPDKTAVQSSSPPIIPATQSFLDRPYVCLHCSAAFARFINLRLHVAVHHGEKVQPLGPDFSRQDSGTGNYGNRKGEGNTKKTRKHMCEVCSRTFSTSSTDMKKRL